MNTPTTMPRSLTGPAENYRQTAQRLIVAHEDAGFIERVLEQFDCLGWEVHAAHSTTEVRRLAQELPAGVIILPTQLQEESGWLLCAKLVREYPGHKVILVGPYATPDLQRYTAFVGGTALLRLDSSMRSLVEEVREAAEGEFMN